MRASQKLCKNPSLYDPLAIPQLPSRGASAPQAMELGSWWGRVEKTVADTNDAYVWMHEVKVGTSCDRREVADPVVDLLLKSLRAFGEHRFARTEYYDTGRRIEQDVNYNEFIKLFTVERDTRPWAQLARTAHLMKSARRCMLFIKDAYGDIGVTDGRWEAEFNEAREKRIKRLKEWRENRVDKWVLDLRKAEGRELWMLLSYSLKRSRVVSEQRKQSSLSTMTDGELSEIEMSETSKAIAELATFKNEELPTCFVPSYEVTIPKSGNIASWGDAEVSIRFASCISEDDEEPAGFSEDEMLHQSDILSDLHHPNIVQFFGMCHVGATRFYLYEKFVENKFLLQDINTQWEIWRSCALVLHYLLERGMSYDEFSREKIVKAHSQDKYVLLSTGISANEATDPSVIPERFVENMKSFAEMIVEDVGRIFGSNFKVEMTTSAESTIPDTMEKSTWNMLQLFCSSCLLESRSPSQALFALGEIVKKEGSYEKIKKVAADEDMNCLSDTDKPIDQVKAYLKGHEKSFAKIMGDLDSQIHTKSANDELVLSKLHHVYKSLKDASQPLPLLMIEAFFGAVERFVQHIDARFDNNDEDACNENFNRRSSIQFMVLKTLENLTHALNTDKFASFESLRSWRAVFRKNYTSQLADVSEVELINLFERTKRSGYPFNCYSERESTVKETSTDTRQSSKKVTLEPWFIPPYEVEVECQDSYNSANGSFGVVTCGRWFNTEVGVKRVFADRSRAIIISNGVNSITNPSDFKREADIWFSLTHPNVIRLYGASSIRSSMYFVCEYARESDLAHFIEKKSEPRPVWRLLKETAAALEYLHARGIIHRDLKCDNILVGNNHQARLADFNLSAPNGVEVELANGAQNYKAPELRTGSTPNEASDVFSLGKCIEQANGILNLESDLVNQMIDDDPANRLSVSVVIMRLDQLANPK